ncbi:MAG: hypothetical protein IIC29_02370 [Chloroflexi bacterium]|nr:hypothetical protein [Chloroflexota bacterium]MCH8817942.1 hypothetical protein [Chloroflexota bacterium]
MTWARIRRIRRYVRRGADLNVAADLTPGISASTVYRHYRNGNSDLQAGDSTTPDARFAQMINRERARFEMGNVDILMDSRADDPRNARWLLEHHPATRDRWGDRTDTVTDAAAAALALLAARLPPPPPAASLAAAPLSLVDKEDQ